MKVKRPTEFESFDKVMSGLLAVPYAELQEKLPGPPHATIPDKSR